MNSRQTNSPEVSASSHGTGSLGIPRHALFTPPSLSPELRQSLYKELGRIEYFEACLIDSGEPRNPLCAVTRAGDVARAGWRKEEKKKLAEANNCTTKQLDGLGASLTKFIDGFYNHYLLRTKLQPSQLPYRTFQRLVYCIVQDVSNAPTYQERVSLLTNISRLQTLKPIENVISAKELRILYGLLVNESRNIEELRRFSKEFKPPPSCVIEIPLLSVSQDERLSGYRASALSTDFDNVVKNEWRNRWRDSVARAISTFSVPTSRAVCLPGVTTPEKELSIYRENNFREIIAVERGDTDDHGRGLNTFRYQMRKIAPEYPSVRPYFGELARCLDELASTNKRASTVALDFDGYACEESLRTAHRLLLTERAHVMVNLLASREHGFLKDTWKSLVAMYPHLLDRPESGQEFNQNQYRDLLLDYTFLYSIGITREENWQGFAEGVRKARTHWEQGAQPLALGDKQLEVAKRVQFINWYQQAIRDCCQWFERSLPRALGLNHLYNKKNDVTHEFRDGLINSELMATLPRLILNASLGLPLVYEIERIRYQSSSSHRNLPYHSFFATIDTPLSTYGKFADLVKFFQSLVEIASSRPPRISGSPEIRSLVLVSAELKSLSDRHNLDPQRKLRHNDLLCLAVDQQIRPEYSLQVDALVEGCRAYARLEKDYYLREANEISTVSRSVIND